MAKPGQCPSLAYRSRYGLRETVHCLGPSKSYHPQQLHNFQPRHARSTFQLRVARPRFLPQFIKRVCNRFPKNGVYMPMYETGSFAILKRAENENLKVYSSLLKWPRPPVPRRRLHNLLSSFAPLQNRLSEIRNCHWGLRNGAASSWFHCRLFDIVYSSA